MSTHRSRLASLWLAIAALMTAGTAHAVLLNESFGATSPSFIDTALAGTTEILHPALAGTVQADTLTSFDFGGVAGSVQNRVVKEGGAGTLDFYWKVTVDTVDPAGGSSGVTAFRLGDFGYDNIRDADWRIDGLGSVSVLTGRVFNPNISSYGTGFVNFLFDGSVGAGISSRFFFLHTDATNYAATAQYDLLCNDSNCISQSFSTYAPAAPIPEPETYALMIAGLGLLVFARMHRPDRTRGHV